jgi:hypothetical protein
MLAALGGRRDVEPLFATVGTLVGVHPRATAGSAEHDLEALVSGLVVVMDMDRVGLKVATVEVVTAVPARGLILLTAVGDQLVAVGLANALAALREVVDDRGERAGGLCLDVGREFVGGDLALLRGLAKTAPWGAALSLFRVGTIGWCIGCHGQPR